MSQPPHAQVRTTPPIALTIAGSDSSGGAGIQADLKTFSAFGVYAATVITALTAQNTRGVSGVLATPAAFITAQIDAVASDLALRAVKTGMLATAVAVNAVCDGIERHGLGPLITDPVMVATSGDVLLDADAITAVRMRLIPLALLITPNLQEAARLLDVPVARDPDEMAQQARQLAMTFRARNVLIKGGHGAGEAAIDILLSADGTLHTLALPRLAVTNTHGTGCTLSAAIAALISRDVPLVEAVTRAKQYVWQALAAGNALNIGQGNGPVDHLYAMRQQPLPA
jgi:hydroxymethylpyrimidine/phosphomethylpyrimidine kinase